MKQCSTFNRKEDYPRIDGVCILDEINIVLMCREEYEKILKEIKIPNITTTREDIIRVYDSIFKTMEHPSSKRINETNWQKNSNNYLYSCICSKPKM